MRRSAAAAPSRVTLTPVTRSPSESFTVPLMLPVWTVVDACAALCFCSSGAGSGAFTSAAEEGLLVAPATALFDSGLVSCAHKKGAATSDREIRNAARRIQKSKRINLPSSGNLVLSRGTPRDGFSRERTPGHGPPAEVRPGGK